MTNGSDAMRGLSRLQLALALFRAVKRFNSQAAKQRLPSSTRVTETAEEATSLLRSRSPWLPLARFTSFASSLQPPAAFPPLPKAPGQAFADESRGRNRRCRACPLIGPFFPLSPARPTNLLSLAWSVLYLACLDPTTSRQEERVTGAPSSAFHQRRSARNSKAQAVHSRLPPHPI